VSMAADYDRAVHAMRHDRTVSRGVLDMRELIRCGTLAASSHNTQPWRFRIAADAVTIYPDYARRCPAVDPDDSHLFKSLGCAAENLTHAAAAQGFASEVHFDADVDAVVVRLIRSWSTHATPLFSAISRRQCTRTDYDGRPLIEADLAALTRAADAPGVRTILLLSDADKNQVVDYVTQGNYTQLRDRDFRDELVSWIRFNPRSALRNGDGLAGRANGQPSLPTWVANGLARVILNPKRQADTDARRIRSSAGVAVFVSSRDDKAGWVDVGRAYERFALLATTLNIRNAFVNQPIEVPTLRPQFESWLHLGGERALLLVRFGHGPTLPFSPRRSLDDVIDRENETPSTATAPHLGVAASAGSA
jgi:hypothetical protein